MRPSGYYYCGTCEDTTHSRFCPRCQQESRFVRIVATRAERGRQWFKAIRAMISAIPDNDNKHHENTKTL